MYSVKFCIENSDDCQPESLNGKQVFRSLDTAIGYAVRTIGYRLENSTKGEYTYHPRITYNYASEKNITIYAPDIVAWITKLDVI
jgi:hypothetical protein